jgi:hypothetical protein
LNKFETAIHTGENTQQGLNFDETMKLNTKVEDEMTNTYMSDHDDTV